MAWRAPEFVMMTVETPTRKSDVFSLGMCIIETLKGEAPWGANLSSDKFIVMAASRLTNRLN